MHTLCVTRRTTFRALPALLLAKRKDVTAVATPVGSHVGEWFEAVGDAVVELGLVRIRFCVGLGDTLGDHLLVALLVARVLAVRALHTGSVLEEVAAKGASHDVIELLLDELVTVLLVDLFLALTNGTLAAETNVERPAILVFLGCDTVSLSHNTLSLRDLPKLSVS